MGLVKCTGILRHHFWGHYVAGIALEFENEKAALDALEIFSRDSAWKGIEQGETHKTILVLTTEVIDAVKATLEKYRYKSIPCGRASCRHGCRNAEIDNLNHSIDLGAKFTLEIDTTPMEQEVLFK